MFLFIFFFSSRRRHTRFKCDWSSDVCSSDLSEIGDTHFKSRTLDTTWPAEGGAAGLKDALDALCARAEAAVREGINIILLSHRRGRPAQRPNPALPPPPGVRPSPLSPRPPTLLALAVGT